MSHAICVLSWPSNYLAVGAQMHPRLNNTMTTKLILTVGFGIAASAYAGDLIVPAMEAPASSPAGDWCDNLKTFGTLYSDKENPYIQEFKVFGRLQYQWGYTDGDNNDTDFSGNGDELRRLRAGVQVKFLNGFKLKANANLEEGGFRNHELGYGGLDEAYLAYTFKNVANFDALEIAYGRHKFNFSQEAHTSSKEIKTVERSNIANFFYNSARPTGALATLEREGLVLTGGIFSTTDDDEIAGWNDGNAYYLSGEFKAGPGDIILDYVYNDVDAEDDDIIGYEWGVSAAYVTKVANFDLAINGLYGETQDGDAVYGLVIMPSTFIIEDKLEAVARYQYFGSDGDNVKINSRNVRNVASHDGVSVGSGDENHTLYGGLNYYLCDHNAKIMAGVEYEVLDGSDVDLSATTLWTGFRMFF